MKTLGLLGGMSWESTAIYYRLINEIVRERLGGLHSAELLLWSFDFEGIAALQAAGEWDKAGTLLADVARRLEGAGAEGLLICTNTMHKLADQVHAAVSVPIIHIADATGAAVRKAGVKRPALLATRFTMEQDFYKQRLVERWGLAPVVPDQAGRDLVHRIIYDELCQGIVTEVSKLAFVEEVKRLRMSDAVDGVVMGCTEISLLIGQRDFDMPVFDTTRLHAEAAVAFALG